MSRPVLLGYGAADERVPPAHGEWFRDRLPDARLEVRVRAWDTWSWCRSGAPRSTTCW